MAAISFKTVDIPESNTGRVKTPNPYLVFAEAAVKARGEKNEAGEYPAARGISYTLKADEKVATLTRKVREAGQDLDVTVRVRDNKDGTVTLWAVDRITRAPKEKDESAEA